MMITFLTQWLIPIVHIMGLSIAIWAFRKSKKKGYIVIAIFFALAIFAYVAMPKINRTISKQNTQPISDEKRDEMAREINVIYQRYYEEEKIEPETVTLILKIPFGEIVLVSGLWLLARKENKSEPEVGVYAKNAG